MQAKRLNSEAHGIQVTLFSYEQMRAKGILCGACGDDNDTNYSDLINV